MTDKAKSTIYRFELPCGCCGNLRLAYSGATNAYGYDAVVDYMPSHLHDRISPEGYIRSPSEPDKEALIAHIEREDDERVADLVVPAIGINRFHTRIWRPGQTAPDMKCEGYNDATTSFLSLQKDLADLLRVIEPRPQNDCAFGHATRELLLLVCTEVELMWRSVLVCNGYAQGRYSTNDYVKVLAPLRLDQWSVTLVRYPDYPEMFPFRGWNSLEPTKSLSWYNGYNKAKHDRASNFHDATFGAVLTSMAGLYVLLAAQFGVGLANDYVREPDSDERRVFRVKSRPAFPLSDQYVLGAARTHVHLSF